MPNYNNMMELILKSMMNKPNMGAMGGAPSMYGSKQGALTPSPNYNPLSVPQTSSVQGALSPTSNMGTTTGALESEPFQSMAFQKMPAMQGVSGLTDMLNELAKKQANKMQFGQKFNWSQPKTAPYELIKKLMQARGGSGGTAF